jgi:recombination protein RecA
MSEKEEKGASKRAAAAVAAGEADQEKRGEALKRALTQIERQFGKGAVMRLGAGQTFDVGMIPTGSVSLDLALGVGGVPRGRVTEVFGPEASGKTTLGIHIIANAQKAGGTAAFIDAEHAFDTEYASRLGVKLEDLLVSQPDNGEQALDVAELLVRSNAVDVIVVDSVAALVPKAEIDGEMGDQFVGLQARLMSHALRKLSGAISKSKTCVVFINQIREKIGVMYGNPEVTPGGRALKFYASVRIDIRRVGSIKNGEQVIGNRVRAKVVKNKVAPPFKSAEFDIMFGLGISREGDLLDSGLLLGAVERSGAWLSCGELRLGQGRENAKQFLLDNRDVAAELEKTILEKARATKGLPTAPKEEAPATEEA